MHIVYSQILLGGGRHQNPRFFREPLVEATSVTIDGDYPEIEGAYRALGAKVTILGEAPISPAPEAPEPAGMVAEDWPPVVDIPEAWEELNWPVLRKLASQCSREPVLNRLQAEAAIEAELDRREALED